MTHTTPLTSGFSSEPVPKRRQHHLNFRNDPYAHSALHSRHDNATGRLRFNLNRFSSSNFAEGRFFYVPGKTRVHNINSIRRNFSDHIQMQEFIANRSSRCHARALFLYCDEVRNRDDECFVLKCFSIGITISALNSWNWRNSFKR